MKTNVIIPPAALVSLQRFYNAWSGGGILSLFAVKYGITDNHIRDKAMAEGVTFTEAVRRMVVAQHPEIDALWPERKPTKAQLEGYRKNAAKSVVLPSETIAAARVILNLLTNPDSGQAKRRAHEWLKRHGVDRLEDVA